MSVFLRSRILVSVFLVFILFVDHNAAARTSQSNAGLVVADSELASAAGMEVLKRGGNAVDAAIATALALSVVDQASSGLGGGGFMVVYRAKEQKSFALDFRETAPRASRRELYTKDGAAAPSLSLAGGLAVGVPGEVAGLIEAQKRFGTMSLKILAEPAIRLATGGFPLDPTLRIAIERQHAAMKRFTELGGVYLANGAVPAEGTVIRHRPWARR
jgi:gamma-glutamyltranspeptidase/glutathione hydrolase